MFKMIPLVGCCFLSGFGQCNPEPDKLLLAPVQCKEPMPANFDAAIQSAFASRPGTPGVVVGVYRPDIGFSVAAYGNEFVCTNPTCEDRLMSKQHLFEIGSVMKIFRWVILHKLAEDGLLSLDDLVNTHIPSPMLPDVTIRDLMHHTSGMIDLIDVPNLQNILRADTTREYFYDDAMNLLLGSTGILDFGASATNGMIDGFIPGTDYHYSTFGPLIAGKIAEDVAGKNIRELVHERILDPLRLHRTSHVFYEPRPLSVAQGYESAGKANDYILEYEHATAISSLLDGLMYSSACDIIHYSHQVFDDTPFLSNETRTAMTTDVVDAGGGTLAGLGVIQYGVTPNFWGHAGASIHGHSSYMAHRASDHLSIVVLSNIDSDYDHWQTHTAVVNALGGL